jgi:hypothetical protein
MQPYRETLWPSPWVIIALALVVPATMLVLAPVSLPAGVIGAVVLYGGCLALAFGSAPRIEVSGATLSVGKASIPLAQVGDVVVYTGADATAQLRTKLDARAWLMIRGWVHSLGRPDAVLVVVVPSAAAARRRDRRCTLDRLNPGEPHPPGATTTEPLRIEIRRGSVYR